MYKKNHFFIFLMSVFLLVCFVSVSSHAANDQGQRILVYVDGQRVAFPDQQPYLDKKNRTLVPVRFVSETLGADVGWNGKSREVSVKHEVKEKDIKLWVNKENYTLNGQNKTMDTSAVLTQKARVMVPLRFVSEGLGAVVRWQVVDGNGVVHNFTLGQSEDEIKDIMDKVKKEIQGEAESKTVDVEKTGADMKSKDWVAKPKSMAKYVIDSRNAKITYVTVDDLKSNDYQLSNTCSIIDLWIDGEYIYVKQSGSGSSADMFLAEGKNLNRYRESHYFSYPSGTFEARYSIVNDRRDQYIPMPTCDITKVSHILLNHGNSFLAVENPKYKGEK